MKDYIYSIIIPHKNIPDLLQRCLDSIPIRDDVQVIIVDDNSDPEIVDFEHFPGLNSINVEVYFDKTGRGAGRARNVGLEHVKGQWILFADADDIFEKGITQIFEDLKTKDCEILYFDIISKDSDTLELTSESTYFSQIIQNKDDFELKYCLLTPWMKAIKISLLKNNNIRFEEVPCSNDTRFSALCGYYAHKIDTTSTIGYCWMRRQNSLWRKKNREWYITRYRVNLRIAHFMRNHHEDSAYQYFIKTAEGFLYPLHNISCIDLLVGQIELGWLTMNLKKLCCQVPRYALYCIKKKLFF